MEENIRLYMEDWLYNSGLVGFYNILNEAGDEVIVNESYLEFNPEHIINFEEKYFNYFINRYEKSMSWYKIVSFDNFIKYHEETNFKEFNKDNLETLNKYIKDVAKRYVKSNSYKAAYDLIGSEIDVLGLEKRLSTIKLKKKEEIKDIIPIVKDTMNILSQIINFMKKEDSKKYLAAKNAIYTIIKNAWDGICFLNPQTKEKDMYKDYQQYFLSTVNEYVEMDKTKFKYNCFICDSNIKDFKNDLSFLNSTGFDVSRKSSHVWDFNNDIATCPICRLIYSCTPAGINYVFNKGIYINDNSTMENAIDVNNKISREILKEHEVNRSLTYRALITSIEEQFVESSKYDLSDIQVIKYDEGKYKFNILSRNILNLIYKSKNELNTLVKAGYKEINTYFNIYDLVIDSLLNNQNLNLIIHKLLVYKLSIPRDCFYSGKQIIGVMNINYRFIRGLGCMERLEEDIVKKANQQGYFLRMEYRNKKSESKLNGISYRLLNALKVNSKDRFMDTVLNCYLYTNKAVPAILLEGLKDDVAFKTIGYAFVSGLIMEKENVKNGGDQ